MKRLLFLAALSAIVLVSCHTNRLAEFNVRGKSALYRTTISSSAAQALAVISPPSDNAVVNIATAIGSAVLTAESQKKLVRAMNGDTLTHAVGLGIRQSTAEYLSIRAVDDVAENPELMIETELTDCNLVSTSAGLGLNVRAKSRMIERRSGRLIWDNAETHIIPLSQTYLAVLGPRGVQTGMSIFNAIQLLNLSEEELRTVIAAAAKDAGREIGETLREDVADLHE